MQKKGSSCDFKKSLRAHWFFSLRAKPITSSVFQLSGATSSFRTRHNEKNARFVVFYKYNETVYEILVLIT